MRERGTPRPPDPARWPTRVLRLLAAAFGVAVAAAIVGLGIWRTSPASVLFPVFLLAFALGGDRLAAAVTGLCFGVRDTARTEPASGHGFWSDGVPDDLLDAYERASIRAGIAPEAAWLVHLAVASRTDPGDVPACETLGIRRLPSMRRRSATPSSTRCGVRWATWATACWRSWASKTEKRSDGPWRHWWPRASSKTTPAREPTGLRALSEPPTRSPDRRASTAGSVGPVSRAASSLWDSATEALRDDPHLGPLLAAAPPCPLAPERGVFRRLTRAIFGQQLSAKGAATLFARFEAHAGRTTPANVLAACRDGGLDDETLRFCGLSRQKRSYLVDLAERFADGRLDGRKLGRMSDADAVAALTAVRGVGVWTAEMWLIFGAARPDVWPVDDLAIRIATGRALGPPRPADAEGDRGPRRALAAPPHPRGVGALALARRDAGAGAVEACRRGGAAGTGGGSCGKADRHRPTRPHPADDLIRIRIPNLRSCRSRSQGSGSSRRRR